MDGQKTSEEFSSEKAAVILRLLWRGRLGVERGSRGPRKRLNVDEILDAAIALAGEIGLESFSMRKVAERIGVSVMALYTYVPDRSGLLGLMVDEVAGRTPLPVLSGSVRERLRAISAVLWEEYHRHPWLPEALSHRPWIGPHLSARYEWELEALEDSGLDDISMDHTIALIESHTLASAVAGLQAERLAAASGVSDLEWWQANAPILDQVMTEDDFPVSGRVGQAVGEAYQAVTSHQAIYEYGLEVILDGLEARLRAAGGGA